MPCQITAGRARDIMHLYKPRGWKIVMGGAQQAGASGLCDYVNRTLWVPLVCDDYSLVVFLHEVAHSKLHADVRYPAHIQEYEAEQWAFKALRACGFKVTRDILMRAKDNVRDHVVCDIVRGLPINQHIKRWVGKVITEKLRRRYVR